MGNDASGGEQLGSAWAASAAVSAAPEISTIGARAGPAMTSPRPVVAPMIPASAMCLVRIEAAIDVS